MVIFHCFLYVHQRVAIDQKMWAQGAIKNHGCPEMDEVLQEVTLNLGIQALKGRFARIA